MLRRLKFNESQIFLIILGLILILVLLNKFCIEFLWFQEVDYLSVFLKKLFWQLLLGFSIGLFSLWFLLNNLSVAQRWKWVLYEKPKRYEKMIDGSIQPIEKPLIKSQFFEIRFPWLLILVGVMTIWLGLIILGYAQIIYRVWTPDYYLPNIKVSQSTPFSFLWLRQVGKDLITDGRKLAIVTTIIISVILSTKWTLRAISILLSSLFGLLFALNWEIILKFLNATLFNNIDPQFSKDISFYIFTIPFWQLLDTWIEGLLLTTIISVCLIYFLSADSLSQGKFLGLTREQLHHLCLLWGSLMALLALRHILERFQLVYSTTGIVYGASFTDIRVQQYVEIILSFIAIFASICFFWKAITGRNLLRKVFYPLSHKKSIILALIPIILYLGFMFFGILLRDSVQKIIVEPNELEKEKPYISRSISSTRTAFSLDKIEAKVFNPIGDITPQVLQNNELTINNISLWNSRPLLEANRQLQQIRLYYKFPDADVDRYPIKFQSQQQDDPFISEKQQIIIAARELDYTALPESARTWVNEHLVYTHGYGFTLSPVNLADEGGLPYYFVKDIGTAEEPGALRTSSKLVQQSIPISKPRIYFGELTNNYVITSTKVKEFDFPNGDENTYNIYDGTGGIAIGSPITRGLFATYLKDWQMLFNKDFTPQTKLLFRRNITERVRAIAPFLNYDQNPYLVAADISNETQISNNSKLFWILDAYTISDRYPYSDPGKFNFNYIRNSVKVVIDAYNGTVNFYIADEQDPIIQTWKKILPELFKPLAAMPKNLQIHLRYPEDFFRTQAEHLLTYHMIDPQVFYNREDQWQIPIEIYGNEQQEVKPYHLIMRLPEEPSEEFVLLQPYTPTSRPNLIGWLAARSDTPNYGKLLLYQFPKQQLVYGPNQLEALINQNPTISQQISLWNREGSKVLQGNLLIIPIEQSLLYVEPIYIVADQNGLPTLAKVIVIYDNQIVMEDTLKDSLEKIFGAV
ncbi:hypothetical protein C7H19_06400 [Aphanothece hegewaldii CCALA 016]|uniref:UPF0182 protein C7H19_06400 n=1 Tax=Aphanothece hegewaldii CCALA 016 TaxID=2107694 RepID=A0A2T1M0C0_9CHRO|nr:UPF0182 family protein [Aphanothece hegewaldii]PSF38097.1 hypothetical protein C7H19_06400 [Aphanothece hegewaldii CCALA 016]